MRFNKDIIICGDIHGMWKYLNQLINKKKPSIILQCGDWGHFPGRKIKATTVNGMRIPGFDPLGVKAGSTEIFFCPGNHEHWDDLDLRVSTPCELMPNVFYMRRGSTITLPDGRVVLFVGGAESIDKEARTPGVDWFPQEVLPVSTLYKIEERKIKHVDIVISHTCPQEFNPIMNEKSSLKYSGWTYKFRDTSQEVLSEILHEFKPSLWYFGHFHVNMKGVYKHIQDSCTRWFCLNDTPNTGWWRHLDT